MLYAAWAAAMAATGWLLAIGAVRLLAYRSGEVDHTTGMRNVAILALALGGLSVAVLVGLTVAIAIN